MKTLRLCHRTRAWFAAATGAVAILLAANPAAQGAVARSKHDLSITGTGAFKAASESDICIFCHTPHKATIDPSNPPLWNRSLLPVSYTPYSSTTLKAAVGQPNGASKLCLTCHDGTIALGLVNSRPAGIPMESGAGALTGRTLFGTDLSGHHPVSFRYDAALANDAGQLNDPATLVNRVRLDRNQQMQCTSCHDPHNNAFGNFLVQDNTQSALCLNCHRPNGWVNAAHRLSTRTWSGAGLDPWPHTEKTTVAENGCENCHAPHNAGTRQRLLNYADEEQNCSICHSGNVAATNVMAEFSKSSFHPILATSGIHRPDENPINPPRHVECADCHNPHAANAAPATAGAPAGAIVGVRGVSANGTVVNTITYEYELCFRCHADSTARGPARVARQFPQTNTRLAFATANASYHPILAPGKRALVPSLLPPYTTGTILTCTSCHNNDQGPGVGGAGPKGPHGSSFTPILEQSLTLTDGSPESALEYALCYKCHNRSLVVSDDPTSWVHHRKHIVDFGAACTTCHDAHGVATTPYLINFNTLYVQLSSSGRREFNSTGLKQGNCYLKCHDGSGALKDHNPKSY